MIDSCYQETPFISELKRIVTFTINLEREGGMGTVKALKEKDSIALLKYNQKKVAFMPCIKGDLPS
jgi:hypothetical protein